MALFSKGAQKNRVAAVIVANTDAITQKLEGALSREFNKNLLTFSVIDKAEMTNLTMKIEQLESDNDRANIKDMWDTVGHHYSDANNQRSRQVN